MSLLELVAEVEDREMTLTVYNADPEMSRDIRERFADRNLVVESATTASGKPEAYVTLSNESGVLTATSVADLQAMFEDSGPIGADVQAYRPVIDYLSETLFTSWDPEKMLAATREIEDRAWRIKRGRLLVGFQNLDVFETVRDVYERLAGSDLDIEMYTTPNGDPPSIDGITVHVEPSPEIERCWFVVYDGAGADENKCALVAEEREPRHYYGFWTYDPETVDRIFTHLEATYNHVEH